jgi:predicted dehydrogenase
MTAETRAMLALAARKGLVLNSFHYRFHLATRRANAIVNGGDLGEIKHIHTSLAIPRRVVTDGDIRFQLELDGGSFIDMGCLPLPARLATLYNRPIAPHRAYVTLCPSRAT